MMAGLMHHLVRYRIRYAAATALLLLFSCFQLAHMAFNGDINVMFDRNDPYLIRLHELHDTYEESAYLLMLVEPANRDVFSPEGMRLVRVVTDKAALLPYAQRVDSLTRFPHVSVDGDSLKIEDSLTSASDMTPALIARIRQLSMDDPRVRGRLVSKGGEVAAIAVTLALPDNHLEGILAVKRASRILRDEVLSAFPGTRLLFTGELEVENAILDVTMDDMLRVNPLVFATIFLLTGVFLRSWMATAATIAVVSAATGIAMGLLIRIGFDINPITMMAPAIIMVLAVADAIHILTQYVLHRQQGHDAVKAMALSLQHNARPVFWTSFTTAIGFLGLNFGDSPPFRDMGNMAAVGVLCAFVCTYTVLPAVMLLVPSVRQPRPLALRGLMRQVARMAVRIPPVTLALVLVAVGYLLVETGRLRVNDDLAHYFDESLEIQQSIQFARQHVQGVEYILYSLDSGQPDGINDPAFLQKVDDFSRWLRQQPEVVGVDSYVDLVKEVHQAMHRDDPAFYRVPERRDLIAQYFLLYEIALPEGMDLTRDVSRDRSSLRVVVNLAASENQTLLDIENRADQWLLQHYPELQSRGTSQLLMFAHLGTNIIHSMIDGSLFTLLFVTVMMMVGLRSVRFGLLSMLPNVCPPVVVYGVWSLLVGEVNHAAAMTFSICLGLVVDDTIHLMSKYVEGRRTGLTAEDAIKEALLSSGTAVVITSLTLVAGIGLLQLSHFTVNDTMSLMLAGIILTALVFDLLMLPALLMWCDGVKGWYSTPVKQAKLQ